MTLTTMSSSASSCATMMFAGLMSRCTRFCRAAAASARAACKTMRRAVVHRQRPLAAHERVERFAVDELHRVEEMLAVVAEVVNAGDVAMPQRGRGPRLAHEALAGVGMSSSAALTTFSATSQHRFTSNALYVMPIGPGRVPRACRPRGAAPRNAGSCGGFGHVRRIRRRQWQGAGELIGRDPATAAAQVIRRVYGGRSNGAGRSALFDVFYADAGLFDSRFVLMFRSSR